MRGSMSLMGGLLWCAGALACSSPAQPEAAGIDDDGVRRRAEAFSIERVDKIDLLFVIDNSGSMAGEQAALRAQFPRLMEALTTGLQAPGDERPFTPVRDLHVGVVSTDMGIPGVELPPLCHADGGDDGILLSQPNAGAGCNASYPPFLSYQAGSSDPAQLAQDFACIATLGTGGCGFEQQLEAPLKALTPRILIDAEGRPSDMSPIRFIATDVMRTWGRGDLSTTEGGNLGFLRNGPDQSLLAIVLLTDEEDCSVRSTEHLRPNNQLPEGDPLRAEDINLRCFNHPEFYYDVRDRYLKGFRALRPGREDLVVFSAIVGVPPDLVSAEVMAKTDLADDKSREAFYDKILKDPRMAYEIDPSTMPGTGQGNIKPSCLRDVPGEAIPSTAFPPRRIVELARAFGPNGMVQSICQDDFGPAIDMLVHSMAKPLTEMCMPQRLIRDDADRVSCKLFWELPTAAEAERFGTPTECALLETMVDHDVPTEVGENGGQRCAIRQLAVRDGAVADSGEGWYYDDFTPELDAKCAAGLQRIAFSERAYPPRGVAVKLECEAGAQQSERL